jgi:signal peptidase I
MSKQKSKVQEYAEAIIIAILIALFIRTFVVQAFKIPSGSMKPTLLIGDHLLVSKFSYGVKIPYLRTTIIPWNEPKRGDIVVFIYPEDRSKDFIKRVIGVAGDTIEIRNKKIFLNGMPYEDGHGVYVEDFVIPAAVQPGTISAPSRFLRERSSPWATIGTRVTTAVSGDLSTSGRPGKGLVYLLVLGQREHRVRWNRIGSLLQ